MSNEILQRVIGVIAATQRMPAERITPASTFQDLGIDSLDGINILFALENEFNVNIPDDAARQVSNIEELAHGIERLMRGEEGATA